MKLISFIILVVAIAGALLDYFSLPIAGINQAGKCVYIIEKGVKRDCDRMPPKYIKERVAGHDKDAER